MALTGSINYKKTKHLFEIFILFAEITLLLFGLSCGPYFGVKSLPAGVDC